MSKKESSNQKTYKKKKVLLSFPPKKKFSQFYFSHSDPHDRDDPWDFVYKYDMLYSKNKYL